MTNNFGLMCCICFSGLTPEECAVDKDGIKWDVCQVSKDNWNPGENDAPIYTEVPADSCREAAGIE